MEYLAVTKAQKKRVSRALARERHRRYNNSKKGRERSKRWAASVRKEVIAHYGNKCSYCGESKIEFLCLDHINNGKGNPADRSHGTGVTFYSWVKRNGYPRELQVLCHNCNIAKELYGLVPGEDKDAESHECSIVGCHKESIGDGKIWKDGEWLDSPMCKLHRSSSLAEYNKGY